ncbi:MAG TPA: (deoxy)nucleoside triphosphate pyrophosphohydrolase [Candidatus Wallbacteria bacterium]|nr:(deoxy)nucleoside triphosphate pyrophosphohydrolase [Candidatus Wallbacteria bacterium]
MGPKLPIIVTAAVIIDAEKKLFLARRHSHDDCGGLWEFPGGKLEPGETPAKCLEREIMEELGFEIKAFRPFNFSYWEYSGKNILLMAYLCAPVSGTPKKLDCADFGYFTSAGIKTGGIQIAPADVALLEEIVERKLIS